MQIFKANWDSDVITITEINNLLDDIRSIKNISENRILFRIFINALYFDELIIAHLYNICLEHNTINFEIHISNDLNKTLKYKITRYLSYARLSLPSQIIFFYNGSELKVQKGIPSTYFPILLVNSIKENSIIDFNHIKLNLLEDFENSKDPIDYSSLKELAQATLKDILDIFDLNFFITTKKKNKLRTGKLNEVNSKKILSGIYNVLFENNFFHFSPSQAFIFNSIVKNSTIKDEIKELRKNDESFRVEKLINLLGLIKNWLSFVNDIETGIKQISQNIIEHSGKTSFRGKGIYTGRVHKIKDFIFKKDLDTNLNDWIECYNPEDSLLELNFIDHGKMNLKTSYIKNLLKTIENQKTSNFDTHKYSDDLSILASDDFSVGHFFDFVKINLLHQSERAIGRFGLMIFAQQIIKNKSGFLIISSYEENSKKFQATVVYFKNESLQIISVNDFDITRLCVKNGICISVYIPLVFKQNVLSNTIENPTYESSKSIESSVFNELIKYQNINFGENSTIANSNSSYLKFYSHHQPKDISKDKYLKHSIILGNLSTTKSSIKILNAKVFSENYVFKDFTDWIRFFGQYNLNFSESFELILVDFDKNILKQLCDFCSILPNFFGSKKPVLFFLKINHTFDNDYEFFEKQTLFERNSHQNRQVNLWMNYVLFGNNINECLEFNLKISQYHHNLISILSFDPNIQPKEIDLSSNLFHKNKLLNFELLVINSSTKKTLFEENVESLLNLEIESQFQNLYLKKGLDKKSVYFQKFKGHKISSSHFKLGSKIHIKDFYYAKRMFYNGFYATRFAFIIAKEIVSNINLNDSISLIGNGNYSELMVNSLRLFLNSAGYRNINHDILLENGKLLKSRNNLKECSIIIIPISSTFSTSDRMVRSLKKIQDELQKEPTKNDKKFKIHDIIYSALWINDEFNNSDLLNKLKIIRNISNQYEWDAYSKKQRVFVKLKSHWFSNFNCPLCYPKLGGKEECLLETEPNGVTPSIDFALPKFKSIDFENYRYLINSNSKITSNDFNKNISKDYFSDSIEPNELFISTQFVKKVNNNSYSFFRTGKFLKKLKEKKDVYSIEGLNKWIENIKIYISLEKECVLVSPSISSNSGFINLVNENLLNGTATVLKFNPKEDTLNNFSKFHASLLENKTIIYVDDVISSSKSFFEVSKYILRTSNRKIDFSISLINRMAFDDYFIYQKYFEHENNRIFNFLGFNFPILQKTEKEGLGERYHYYSLMANKSSLDLIRSYFLNKAKNALPHNLDIYGKPLVTDLKSLFDTLVNQVLTQVFKIELNSNLKNYNARNEDINCLYQCFSLMSFLIEKVEKNDLIKEFLDKCPLYKSNIEYTIVNIISEPTFIHHVVIKKEIFTWAVNEYEKFLSLIEIQDDFFQPLEGNLFSEYQNFKLLSKIAAKLRINSIFSVEAFSLIEKILLKLGKKNDGSYKFNRIRDNKTIYPIGLTTYYVSLIQEVVNDDEAKAFKLINNIYNLINSNREKYSLRNNSETDFTNFLRILVVENIYPFETFLNDLYENNLRSKENLSERDIIKGIQNYLELPRYEATKKSLLNFNDSVEDYLLKSSFEKIAFAKILLRSFARKDKQSNRGEGLEKNLNKILQPIYEAFTAEFAEKNNYTNSNGLIYPKGGAFIVFNKSVQSKTENFTNEDLYMFQGYSSDENIPFEKYIYKDSILVKMINGISYDGKISVRTSFELNRIISGEYNFKDEGLQKEDIFRLKNGDFLEDSNNVKYANYFFLRLGDLIEYNHEIIQKPSAILGFYFNPVSVNILESKMVSPKYIRFLLLIRDELQNFIKNEIENDGFHAMVENERKSMDTKQSSHGWETFLNSTNNAIEIFEKDKNDNEKWELLKKTIENLSNKAAFQRRLIEDVYLDSIITWGDLKKQLSDEIRFCFNFKNSNYPEIGLELYEVIFCNTPDAIELNYSNVIYKEIFFEVFYNIRKHTKTSYDCLCDDPSKKLEINISIKDDHLIISNNFSLCNSYPEKLIKSQEIDGIPLINNLIRKILQKEIEIQLEKDIFTIKIPIEIYK